MPIPIGKDMIDVDHYVYLCQMIQFDKVVSRRIQLKWAALKLRHIFSSQILTVEPQDKLSDD